MSGRMAHLLATLASIPLVATPERAGLTAGNVITSVNDVPLANIAAAMVQVLGSDIAGMTIETAAGAHVAVPGASPNSRPQ